MSRLSLSVSNILNSPFLNHHDTRRCVKEDIDKNQNGTGVAMPEQLSIPEERFQAWLQDQYDLSPSCSNFFPMGWIQCRGVSCVERADNCLLPMSKCLRHCYYVLKEDVYLFTQFPARQSDTQHPTPSASSVHEQDHAPASGATDSYTHANTRPHRHIRDPRYAGAVYGE